jgi:DNA-binding NarL/FixJ family response regulator
MNIQKIIIAEDFDTSNEGIISKLRTLDNPEIHTFQTCDQTHLKIQRALQDGEPFDLLISDLSFLNTNAQHRLHSGQELLKAVKQLQPSIKTIAFSLLNKQHIIKELTEDIGVDAYVCKSIHGGKELLKAIKALNEDQTYLCPIAKAALEQKHVFELNNYETQLLQLLANGYKQSDICDYFKSQNIKPFSRRSVEDHLSKLRDHFNANTTAQLIYQAQSLDLI